MGQLRGTTSGFYEGVHNISLEWEQVLLDEDPDYTPKRISSGMFGFMTALGQTALTIIIQLFRYVSINDECSTIGE